MIVLMKKRKKKNRNDIEEEVNPMIWKKEMKNENLVITSWKSKNVWLPCSLLRQ